MKLRWLQCGDSAHTTFIYNIVKRFRLINHWFNVKIRKTKKICIKSVSNKLNKPMVNLIKSVIDHKKKRLQHIYNKKMVQINFN